MSDEKKMTCGPLFRDAVRFYTAGNQDDEELFAAGFVFGQAEKIYLGACLGAMFRPSPETIEHRRGVADEAGRRYGLECRELPTKRGWEIWLLSKTARFAAASDGYSKSPAIWLFEELVAESENSPRWRRLRARLCGVPLEEIDEKFHERRGFGERCDGPAAE